jgi:hypothetical protein
LFGLKGKTHNKRITEKSFVVKGKNAPDNLEWLWGRGDLGGLIAEDCDADFTGIFI